MRRLLPTILCLSSAIPMVVITSCSDHTDRLPLASERQELDKSSEANALLAEARQLEQQGETKKALKRYEKLSEEYPYSTATSDSLISQARIHEQNGDLLEAFEAYDYIVKRFPQNKNYATAVSRQREVAYAAADGRIKNNFLGLKSKLGPQKIEEMLTTVIDNAPGSSAAPKAQFTIGSVWQEEKNAAKAVAAFQKIGLNYPSSSLAPEALYQIGEILVKQAQRGNQNSAHLDRAKEIYMDLKQRFPSHPRAKDARKRIGELGGQDIQRSYQTAEFYRKKGNTQSAIFYYREVLRMTKSGDLHNLAKQRIAELSNPQ